MRGGGILKTLSTRRGSEKCVGPRRPQQCMCAGRAAARARAARLPTEPGCRGRAADLVRLDGGCSAVVRCAGAPSPGPLVPTLPAVSGRLRARAKHERDRARRGAAMRQWWEGRGATQRAKCRGPPPPQCVEAGKSAVRAGPGASGGAVKHGGVAAPQALRAGHEDGTRASGSHAPLS